MCNRSWHLPGNLKLVLYPARLINERGCADLSVDTMHLKDPLVLFGSEGSALTFTLPPFLLSLRVIMLYHFFFNNDIEPLLVIVYGTKQPLCRNVP